MKSLGLKVFKFAVTEEFPEAPSAQMNWFQKADGNCRQNLGKSYEYQWRWEPLTITICFQKLFVIAPAAFRRIGRFVRAFMEAV